MKFDKVIQCHRNYKLEEIFEKLKKDMKGL